MAIGYAFQDCEADVSGLFKSKEMCVRQATHCVLRIQARHNAAIGYLYKAKWFNLVFVHMLVYSS